MRSFEFWTLACTCAMAGAVLFAVGCDDGNGEADAGSDAGEACLMVPELANDEADRPDPSEVTCPDDDTVPAPAEQMGSCCWRYNNEPDQHDTPEFRLTYIEIVGPPGSPLSSRTVRTVLNEAVQEEGFNWLIRVEDAGADGPVNIVTGFGRRQPDGTYQFSEGSASSNPVTGDPDSDEWCPVEVPATLTGDVITSDPIDGSITVPVFNEEETEVQIELTLRNIAVEQGTWGEDRSCIGWNVSRPLTYAPQAVLSGYVEVEPSRTQVIMTTGVETNVCAALAGALSLTYCEDNPQSEWAIQPDSYCDATGCTANEECAEPTVCNPDGGDAGGLPGCNAWRFVAQFAAAGVDITNGLCGG